MTPFAIFIRRNLPFAGAPVHALLSLVLLAMGLGCTAHPLGLPMINRAEDRTNTVDRLNVQRDLMNLADDLISAAGGVYGDIVNGGDNRAKAIRYAQSQRLEIATASLDNAVNVNPLAGLMDTVVLVTLARAEAERPAAQELLGKGHPAVLAMLRTQEASAWAATSRYLTRDQVDELRKSLDQWRRDNPDQRYASHVRLVDFLASRPMLAPGSTPTGSIFSLLFLDPLAGINPAVREIAQSRDIAERMFFYGQRLPLLLSWRIEGVYREMLGAPQIVKIQDQLEDLNETSRRFTEVAAELAKTFDELPFETERVSSQFTTSVTAATETAIRTATTQITAEREAALGQISTDLRQQQEEAARNLESVLTRSIDRFHIAFLRAALMLIVAFFLVLLIYRLLTHRLIQRRADDGTASRGS